MDFKIKICGMKDPDNFSVVSELNPDYLGLIFYQHSQRYMRDSLKPANVSMGNSKKVGVFVNAPIDEVNSMIELYQLDAIQLHGQESPEYCSTFINQTQVIKAFAIDNAFDFEKTISYEKVCRQFLFDTKGDQAGGNGFAFNWEKLKEYKHEVPFFLSGGIGFSNIEDALEINHRKLYGFDINSGAETSLGMKNIDIVKQLINTIKIKSKK